MILDKTIDIEYVCKLIFDTYKATVKFYEPDGSVLYHFSSILTLNPLYQANDLLELIKQEYGKINFPLLQKNNFLESFIIMDFQLDEKKIGKFLIGPILTHNVPEELIDGLLNDYSKITGKNELTFYYNQLPKITTGDLLNLGKLLCFLIFNERLDITEIVKQNEIYMISNTLISNSPELEISKRRENQSFHPPEYYEIEMLKCIREGRKEELRKKLAVTIVGESGILSKKSYLRSQKNLAICGITLATRAAIQGGLDWDSARTLSDVFIQNIEDAMDVQALLKLRNEAMLEFTERVQKRRSEKYSDIINQCLRYIYKHLYENINISQIADVIGVSSGYLASRFRKEVGISLKNYIQQEKVEESKKLIVLTDHPLLDICILLNFNDQSYFTKVFKKVTGLTPKQYKDRGKLI